jgi:NDP-sugar pyrophosphorylase family protein
MTVLHNRDRWDLSNVAFDGAMVRAHAKSAGDRAGLEWIDYGLSVFKAGVIAEWPAPDPVDLCEVTSALAREGRLAGFAVRRRFYEIGKPAGLAETERRLATKGRRGLLGS